MDTILHLFSWYPLYGVPAGIGWAAVWVSAGHKSFDLQRGDKELLVLPWIVLYVMSVLLPESKSLGNFIEVMALAACVPAAMAIRTYRGRIENQARFAHQLALGVSAIAAGLWLLVPPVS